MHWISWKRHDLELVIPRQLDDVTNQNSFQIVTLQAITFRSNYPLEDLYFIDL